MNSKDIRTCAVCGALLVGALHAQLCLAAADGKNGLQEPVAVTLPHAHGGHDDRPAEPIVDLDIFTRRIVSVATSYGDAPPGDGFRTQQEVARRWWNRSEYEVWHGHARVQRIINESGLDSTPL